MLTWRSSDLTDLINKELQDECGNAAVDADEEIDGGEDHVSSAGNWEDEGCRVHQWSDGPTAAHTNNTLSI